MATERETSVGAWTWRSADGFEVSTEPARLDFDVICGFISESYWAKGIPRARLKRAMESSICFGVYAEGKLVGFARVISDRACFAYLCDVFVLEHARGRGASKALMAGILAHPDLQDLRRWVLVTLDAHELYRKFGFDTLKAPEGYMERWEPKVYERLAAGTP